MLSSTDLQLVQRDNISVVEAELRQAGEGGGRAKPLTCMERNSHSTSTATTWKHTSSFRLSLDAQHLNTASHHHQLSLPITKPKSGPLGRTARQGIQV